MRPSRQRRPTRPCDNDPLATSQNLETAGAEPAKVETFAAEQKVQRDRISKVIDETRNPADIWDSVSLEQRKTIFDWWVLDVLISVEPLGGRKRANQKSAIPFLHSAPGAPLYFTFGRSLPNAASSSPQDDGSPRTTPARPL
jgi:hypothetical protein